jgi:predicted ATPase/serine/threonine protein kinase/Tfp pilus assembly protein PilF
MSRANLLIGLVLDDKYRLEALLGTGGMGAVYRATQLNLQRTVAVKVLRGDLAADPTVLRRFEREALTVARLKHPHIVTIYDFGMAQGTGAFLAMELLEGHSLRELLRAHGALPLREVVELVEPICSALQTAHAMGVVHRDLKPENIFLETGPTGPVVKVLDFGIAKLVSGAEAAQAPLTADGGVLGTPVYMSPEQCEGKEVDARSDVYSLGCVLYELVTGRPPFLGGRLVDVLRQHMTQAPEAPSRHATDLPPAVESALLRALAKRPETRFQTALELSEAFRTAEPSRMTLWLDGAGADSARTAPPSVSYGSTEVKPIPNNLPEWLTSLVGRDREVREIARELARPEVRLLTLTGPGGTGKTRLALAAAREVLFDYADGVFFVDLSTIRDPALVVSAVAQQLGVKESGLTPLDERLVDYLRHRTLLLVLDNFEQVLDAAPVLTRFVAASPRSKLIVTSRALLRLSVESEFAVPPLGLPSAERGPALDALARFGAIRLFVERAQAARSGFALTEENAPAVTEICRRLEGLPLAIELAAARIRLLSARALLERLDERLKVLTGGARDLPARQQTMRAAISWSYDLLDEGDRRVFERLSVFAGGGMIAAVEAVCGAGESVLDAIESLVEKSLLQRAVRADEDVRLRMLGVVREFALERLRATGGAESVEARHAEVYLELAEAVAPTLAHANVAEGLARLEEEHDNLRAALGWWLEHDPEACLRMAVALRHLWIIRGHLTEGRMWLETALERSDRTPSGLRSLAWRGAGNLALQHGDLDAARGFFEESLRVARELGDARHVGAASYGLGNIAHAIGDVAAARAYFEESLASGRELDDDVLAGNALTGLGEVARTRGEWADARGLYERALEIARNIGNRDAVSALSYNLGAVAAEEGDLRSAWRFYTRALEIDRELGSADGMASSLDGYAAVMARRGAWERAARLAGAAQALRDVAGFEMQPVDRDSRDRYLAEVREHLGDAGYEAALLAGRALTIDEAIELAGAE